VGSLDELKNAVISVEKKVNEIIINFKDDHPILDKAIHESLGLLPPPFNRFAQNIYDQFGGSEGEGINSVLNCLKELKDQDQEHYEKMINELTEIREETSSTNKIITKNEDSQNKRKKEVYKNIVNYLLMSQIPIQNLPEQWEKDKNINPEIRLNHFRGQLKGAKFYFDLYNDLLNKSPELIEMHNLIEFQFFDKVFEQEYNILMSSSNPKKENMQSFLKNIHSLLLSLKKQFPKINE